jgi:hypothetical protein
MVYSDDGELLSTDICASIVASELAVAKASAVVPLLEEALAEAALKPLKRATVLRRKRVETKATSLHLVLQVLRRGRQR